MNCSIRANKLCGDCDVCIKRSVSSHPKGHQYSKENDIDSKFITQKSDKKCLWNCLICLHTIYAKPSSFLKSKNGCGYCANRKLCSKDKKCITCFNKSFASSERAINIVDKTIDLTQIFLNSNKKCEFWCECNHIFLSVFSNVTIGKWCPYCCNAPRLLCHKDKNCITCFNKSFASSDRVINVMDKSIDLTQIFLNQNRTKLRFLCDCHHEFSAICNDVTNGQWCPYCCNPPQKLCHKDKNA